MLINNLSEIAHKHAVEKGFWDQVGELPTPYPAAIKLLLIHAEISEAVEELRETNYSPEKLHEEIADIAIRLADLAGYLGMDLDAEIQRKLLKNADRPYKHGKAF